MALAENRISTPRLHEQMAVCDANYIRLLRLIPGLQNRSGRAVQAVSRSILIPGQSAGQGMRVILAVREHFRFTTEIEVVQLRPHDEGHYRTPRMLVRLYHDAKTAEVISYQQQRTRWVLPAAGSNGWHGLSVEKIQLNAFLGEWLALCLNHGVADQTLLEKGFSKDRDN